VGLRRDRAAAILASMVWVMASSSASSSTINPEGPGWEPWEGEEDLGLDVTVSFGSSDLVTEADGVETFCCRVAFSSFSLCFLEFMCERYAFSVVYTLLKKDVRYDHNVRNNNPHLHTPHVAPLGDVVTAVSARLWSTFWLNMAALIGGRDATLRCREHM
jgi:hypothetical protein